MKHKIWLVAVALALIVLPSPLTAQDQSPNDNIPLRVQVLLSRYEGEKRLASLPYTIWVSATRTPREAPVSLRMGVQVPIPSTTKEGGPSFSYRNVGTNIDCDARILADGRYRLAFGVEQSSIFPDDPKKPQILTPAGPPVTLRSFTTNFTLVLRDGQSAQNTTATDPVSGEVLKIDVTMNVIK